MLNVTKQYGGPPVSHVYRDFSENELNEILSHSNAVSMKQCIATILCMDDTSNEKKINYSREQTNILIDFYFHNVVHVKKLGMDNDKISAYFSIMKDVHERSMDTEVTLIDSFSLFKELLVKHSVYRPPFSIQLFTLEDVKKLSNYAHKTYYRHFKMYQYVFCKKQRTNVETFIARQLNEPSFIVRPLSEATMEEDQKVEEVSTSSPVQSRKTPRKK